MVRELLRIIQWSGISCVLSARDIPANVSLYIKGPPQIKAHLSGRTNCLLYVFYQLWMYNTAKKTGYSDDMLCSLVVCCVLLSALTRTDI